MKNTSLSKPRQQLVALMQQLNFGLLHNLRLRDGEPVLDQTMRIVRHVKFPGENGPRPELEAESFDLKAEVQGMLTFFDQLQNGMVARLEVRHGLPLRMDIEETLRP